MKKSLLIAAIVICAAGVASAAQAPPANINTFQGGALMVTGVSNINNVPATALTGGAGGSSCLTAQAWAASLGTATMAAWSPPNIHRSFVSI